MNDHYKIIKVLGADSTFTPDTHKFDITPQGDALQTGYPDVNLSSVGGSIQGTVIDSIAREVDLKTGKVLLDWSALAHVPITDSHALPLLDASPWDFFHINSISPAPGGNLLISSRHMWALYDINAKTGNINWTLGGKHHEWTGLVTKITVRAKHIAYVRIVALSEAGQQLKASRLLHVAS